MDLEENSKAARTCKLYYEPTRDEMLRAHPWNFAQARAALSQLTTAPPFGFLHSYQLPSDCLRVLSLNRLDAWEPTGLFEIEGRRLLTNQETANIIYIKREEDPQLFDALFVEALSLKLASKLVATMTGDVQASQLFLRELGQMTLPTARRIDAGEPRRPNVTRHDSKLVRARRGEPLEYDDNGGGGSSLSGSSGSSGGTVGTTISDQITAAIQSQVGLTIGFSIPAGSVSASVIYGQTFESAPAYAVVAGANFDAADTPEAVFIDPDDITASGLTVRVENGGHASPITGVVVVKKP